MQILSSKRKYFLFIVSFISQAAFSQTQVDLSENALFILGGAQVEYSVKRFREATHSVKLESDVGGGFFVRDRLAIGGSLPVQWYITEISRKRGVFGLRLFLTYFFKTQSLFFPYLGANITPKYNMNLNMFRFSAGIDSGVLISFSKNVAIDLGIRPEIHIKVSKNDTWQINVPGGFLGVRAFF